MKSSLSPSRHSSFNYTRLNFHTSSESDSESTEFIINRRNSSQYVSNLSATDMNILFPDILRNNTSINMNGNSFDQYSSKNNEGDRNKEKKYKEDFMNLLHKYNQLKEELRVQKQLTGARENREKSLQDQLNKATIELAQLRLTREDLKSELKQSSAKNIYLSRELDKIGQVTSKNEENRQKEVQKIKEQLENNKKELEIEKKNYEVKYQKMKAKNQELTSLLEQTRKQLIRWQDDNFKLKNESRNIAQQYESEKEDFLKTQQRAGELQLKYDKVTNDLFSFREQNEKLNLALIQLQSDLQNLEMENKRCIRDRNMLESQATSLSERLEEASTTALQYQIKLQKTNAKITAMKEEIEQNQKLLEKTKMNLTNDVNSLLQQVTREKSECEKLREEHQNLTEQLIEQSRNLELEKNLKEKAELAEKALKQRINQLEEIANEYDNEIAQMNNQINEMNNKIIQLTNESESKEEQIRDISKRNVELKQKNNELEQELERNAELINLEQYQQMKKNFEDISASNVSMANINHTLQFQLKDIQLKLDSLMIEKQNDQKIIEELQDSLKKESVHLKLSIKERKEAQEIAQSLRDENTEIKNKNSKNETELSLLKAEKEHLSKALNEKQNILKALTESNYALKNENDLINGNLESTRKYNTINSQEVEKLNQELFNSKKELDHAQLIIKSLNQQIDEVNQQYDSFKQNTQESIKNAENVKNHLQEKINHIKDLNDQLEKEKELKEKAMLKAAQNKNMADNVIIALKGSEKQLDSLKQQTVAKENDIVNLQLENNKLKSLNKQYNIENESLQNEKNKLLDKNHELERRLKGELDVQSNLRAQFEDTTDEKVRKLTNANKALTEMLSDSHNKFKDEEKNVAECKNVISSLNNEIAHNQDIISNLNDKIFELQRIISDKEALEKSHLLQNQENSDLLAQLRGENKALKEQISVLEDKNKADKILIESTYRNSLETLKNKYKQNSEEQETSDIKQKEKIQLLQQSLSSKRNDIMKLEAALATSSQRLKALQSQCESSGKQKEILINENTDLKTKIVQNEMQIKQLDKINKKNTKENIKLINKINEMENENNDVTNLRNEYYGAVAKLEQSETLIKQLQNQIELLSSLNDSLSIEIAEATKSRNQTTQEFETITQTVQSIHSLLSNNSTGVIYPSSNYSHSYIDELSELRDTISSSKKEIEDLVHEKKELTTEVNRLKKQLSSTHLEKVDSFTNEPDSSAYRNNSGKNHSYNSYLSQYGYLNHFVSHPIIDNYNI